MTDKPIIDFHWEGLGVEEGGLPKHLPMGVNAEGQGPESDHDAHHWECWCPDKGCPLNAPLRQAWLAGRRVERERFDQIIAAVMNAQEIRHQRRRRPLAVRHRGNPHARHPRHRRRGLMSAHRDGRICAVCGRVLEEVLSDPILYRHAKVDEPADHPPVAVRTEDMPGQVKYRCDFCLEEPVTVTMVVDKEVGIEEMKILWSTEWAMCQPCADLALADDWLNLRRRVFTIQEASIGTLAEETKARMRVVYHELRQHLVMYYIE
jgi:hypothetical protein